MSTQVLLVFLCLQANAEVIPKFQVATACSHAALPFETHQNYPVTDAAKLLVFFQIIDKVIRNSKSCCLFETTSHYHNVFTFTLFLSKGRAVVAWEPSNKMMLFLPPRKINCLSLLPLIFSLHLYFLSLPLLGSRGLTWDPSHCGTSCQRWGTESGWPRDFLHGRPEHETRFQHRL
jgi:hypothetical protein